MRVELCSVSAREHSKLFSVVAAALQDDASAYLLEFLAGVCYVTNAEHRLDLHMRANSLRIGAGRSGFKLSSAQGNPSPRKVLQPKLNKTSPVLSKI